LTFASPTIVTPDKSQVDVATHEICHSWTGNEVTCQNWRNMWLNEGFTVFCERKTTQSLNIANPDIYKVSAYLGNASLWNDIQ
jgi:leukotriene-A4 hydrolase